MTSQLSDLLESGEGKPILFLHGWPFHRGAFSKVIEYLRPSYRCMALNFAGMTDQVWPDDTDYSFQAHAARTIGLIEQVAPDGCAITAHDTGGTTARLIAARRPDLVKHLILLNTEIPNHRPPFIPMYQRTAFWPGTYTIQKWLMRRRWFQRSAAGFGGCFSDPAHIDEAFIEQFGTYWTERRDRHRELMRYLKGVDFSVIDNLDQVHAKIECPVTFIWGEEDPTFPVDLGEQMARSMPTLKAFHRVKKAKFLPHEEHPKTVADLIQSTLQ